MKTEKTRIAVEAGRQGAYGDLSIEVDLPPLRGDPGSVRRAEVKRIATIRGALHHLVSSPRAAKETAGDSRIPAVLDTLALVAAREVRASAWLGGDGLGGEGISGLDLLRAAIHETLRRR